MLYTIPLYRFYSFSWIDIVDIVLVAILIYQLYYLLKGTVAINIFIGILLFYLLWLVVKMLDMQLFGSILGKFIDVGFIALLIVFQQELRRFLLLIGTSDIVTSGRITKKVFDFKWPSDSSSANKLDIKAILKACENMGESKTGALIVIALSNDLRFYANTGDALDAKVSSRILESIFYKNSPLHDGSVIISNNIIIGARCVLPVSEQDNFPVHLGMRHRAAVGITESTDAIAIVVSEQTGDIAYAKAGKLQNKVSSEELRHFLEKELE